MNRKSRLILHAGDFKTATSSIQTILARNRTTLVESGGVLYPETALRLNTGSSDENSLAHHLLYHASRSFLASKSDNAKIFDHLKKLRAEISEKNPNITLLSTELFSKATIAHKRLLVELLSPMNLEVVYCVRRPDDYCESMISQSTKYGRKLEAKVPKVRMLQNIQDWENLVGPDRVTVHYFTQSGYDQYLKNVFLSFGLDLANMDTSQGVHDNPTMTQVGLLMRRLVYRRIEQSGITPDRRMRHRINIALDRLERDFSPSPKATFLSSEMREAIMDSNRQQMEEIASRFSQSDRAAFDSDMKSASSRADRNVDVPPRIDVVAFEKILEEFTSGKINDILRVSAFQRARQLFRL